MNEQTSPLHAQFRQIYDLLIKYQPNEHLLRPKRINVPGGYTALLEAAALAQEGLILANQIKNEHLRGEQRPPSLRETVVTTDYMLIREGMPIYFVAEEFIRAVAATTLPQDLRVEELKWPREAFILSFPTRFMREYIGQDISYVAVANAKAGEYSLGPMIQGLPTLCPTFDKFCVHTMIWNQFAQRPENSLVAWRQTDFLAQAHANYVYTDMMGDATEAALKYKKNTNDLLGNLVLKLLLVLSVREGLIVEGTVERQEKRDKNDRVEQHELWAPNTIGWSYKLVREGTREKHVGWIKREGHLTHQFVGSRKVDLVSTASLPKLSTGEIDWANVDNDTRARFWEQHKLNWIEPIWYNPSEAK